MRYDQIYTFISLTDEAQSFTCGIHDLPSLYPTGTVKEGHAGLHSVIVQSVKRGSNGQRARDEMPMDIIKEQRFTLDVGHTHVVEATG